jgi:hypothetical protein
VLAIVPALHATGAPWDMPRLTDARALLRERLRRSNHKPLSEFRADPATSSLSGSSRWH